MNEKDVQEFWNAHPCGEEMVGGIKNDYQEFFDRYDTFRYTQHSHLLRCLDEIDFQGKSVLEIGLGLGADSEQIIRRGGIWSGIDLTPASIERVKQRMEVRNLSYEQLVNGSACVMPFADNSFDIVFTHGVLHHIPDIHKAQTEIYRILKPKGKLIVMLYAKYSLNYLFSIAIVRRLALMLLYPFPIKAKGVLGQHIRNAHDTGLFNYLQMKSFIHRNTDGPLNPYSKVYDMKKVRKDFPDFKIVHAHKEFMHAPPLPVSILPLARWLGWHLWIHMEPKK
jgi:ubiquinone/menaquinone biosynthesis C-methylase UbiE